MINGMHGDCQARHQRPGDVHDTATAVRTSTAASLTLGGLLHRCDIAMREHERGAVCVRLPAGVSVCDVQHSSPCDLCAQTVDDSSAEQKLHVHGHAAF